MGGVRSCFVCRACGVCIAWWVGRFMWELVDVWCVGGGGGGWTMWGWVENVTIVRAFGGGWSMWWVVGTCGGEREGWR